MKGKEKDCVPVPGPQGLLYVGNIFDVDPQSSSTSFYNLAKKYGEIFKLDLPGERIVFVNNRELLTEVCDETRFQKSVKGVLEHMQSALNNGLITAGTDDKEWEVAHRIVMPLFSPLKIRNMFNHMKDIITQLCLKWARLGPSYVIDVNQDLTRMALDVVGLCAMGYRFNTFYDQSEQHPFVNALNRWLLEANARSFRPDFVNHLHVLSTMRYKEDIKTLRSITEDVIKNRRQNPSDGDDMLSALINGRDPKTGAQLSDKSLVDNILTLLGAGHETTSGTISFALYFLMKNPDAMIKAQQEIDTVLGNEPLRMEHLSKLPYIDAIIRETLRFQPTVPAFSVTSLRDQVIGDKYFIRKGDTVGAMLFAIQRDPKVYGDDADLWKPERMLPEKFKLLPPNSWKPFGNGVRACIGRPFALQESQIALTMILRTFNFEYVDPSYQLRFKDAVTINPLDFKLRAYLRDEARYAELLSTHSNGPVTLSKSPSNTVPTNGDSGGKGGPPMTVLFGSENGACQAFAHRFASGAGARGFSVRVDTLNAAKENIPKDHPVVIFTSSYNGTPPENASHFVTWLQSLSGMEMQHLQYAVFGCGHREWAETFQSVPTLVDKLLAKRGGSRILPLTTADAAVGDMFSDFESWEDVFWPTFSENNISTVTPSSGTINLDVQVAYPRLSSLRETLVQGYVSHTMVLTSTATKTVKKHMELRLESNATYKVGDYVAILPINPVQNVQRVMAYFKLALDSVLEINANGLTNVPTEKPISAMEVFGQYVDLAHTASKRNIQCLASWTKDGSVKEYLKKLAEQDNNVTNIPLFDLIEANPSIEITLGQFLAMLPPLRMRTYSISSSPLNDLRTVTITWSVVNKPIAGDESRRFLGVASNYLAGLINGTLVNLSIRSPRTNFTLPKDPEKTPIIMIAAGTGLAPFRGFIQERYIQIKEGRRLAAAVLFFGCRSPDMDDLYRDELDKWEAAGAVTVHRAYSRPSVGDRKYVQNIIQQHGGRVSALWMQAARCYVCGSSAMAAEIKKTFEHVVGRINDSQSDRYLTEIFS